MAFNPDKFLEDDGFDPDVFTQTEEAPQRKDVFSSLVDQGLISEDTRQDLEGRMALTARLVNGASFGGLRHIMEERAGINFPEVQSEKVKVPFISPLMPLQSFGVALTGKGPGVEVSKELAESGVELAGAFASPLNRLIAMGAGATAKAADPLRKGAGKFLTKNFPEAHRIAKGVRVHTNKWWRNVTDQYGKALDTIAAKVDKASPGGLNPTAVADSIKKKLINSGVLDGNGAKLRSAENSVERQLLKSHKNMLKKADLGKSVSGREFTDEIIKIKKSGGEFRKKVAGKAAKNRMDAFDAAHEVASIADDVSPDLKTLNRWYKRNRTIHRKADEMIDLKDKFSGRGEKTIVGFNSLQKGPKDALNILQKEIGFNFSNAAERVSAYNQLVEKGALSPIFQTTRALGTLLKPAVKASAKPVGKAAQMGTAATAVEALEEIGR